MSIKASAVVAAIICSAITAGPSHASWVNSQSNGVPADAIAGGMDPNGNTLFICRGYVGNSAQPGWRLAGTSQCHFGYGGIEYAVANFDSWTPSWQYDATPSNPPANAVQFGYEKQGIFNLPVPRYPCQTWDQGSLVPGKYATDFASCYAPYGGIEYHGNVFNVLVDAEAGYVNSIGGLADGEDTGPYTMKATSLGNIPFDAIVGGKEANGQLLYLCSAAWGAGYHPGKTRAGFRSCDISYGGKEIFIPTYFVLTPDWLPVSGTFTDCLVSPNCNTLIAQPQPITIGKDSDGTRLYACRVSYLGGTIPGKIRAGWNACDIGQGGRELYPSTNYELLINGFTAPQPQVVIR